MKIFIESELAQQQGKNLINSLGMNGTVSEPENKVKSIDPTAIVEILDIVEKSMEIIGGLSTAAMAWVQEQGIEIW